MGRDDWTPTSPHLWLSARALDPLGHLEWTFSEFLFRHLALEPEAGPDEARGLDLVYESLETWDDVLWSLQLRDVLLEEGLPPTWVPHVSLGMQVFDTAYRAPGGRLPLPTRDDPFRGRHVVGYLDAVSSDEIRFVNSWGDWGDRGAGYITRAYFERHVDAAWVTRPVWLGPSPAMERSVRQRSLCRGAGGYGPQPDDVVAAWTTPNRRAAKTVEVGASWEVRKRSTFATRGLMNPFEVIDVCEENRILGRCHLHHHLASRTSVIEELFVRPGARRQGVGRVLADTAAELARRQGANSIGLWLREADADISGRRAAERFAQRLGYTWFSHTLKRPNVVRVGGKELS